MRAKSLEWGLSLSTIVLGLALQTASAAQIEIGDEVPNLCWQNESRKEFCLEDHSNTVRVLLYSGVRCDKCNRLHRELIPKLAEIKDQSIVSISLITDSLPDQKWMQAWKTAYGVREVGLSHRDTGTVFFSKGHVPGVVVVDTDKTLALKTQEPDAEAIIEAIKELKDAEKEDTSTAR